MNKFGGTSAKRLEQVHPDLQRVMNEAITHSPHDFSITEGLRTIERQKELFDSGKSRTMNSRHLSGHAVDIAVFVDGKVTWDFKFYETVAEHIKVVAILNDVPIKWGGDWETFRDGPHFELDRKRYPS